MPRHEEQKRERRRAERESERSAAESLLDEVLGLVGLDVTASERAAAVQCIRRHLSAPRCDHDAAHCHVPTCHRSAL